MSNSVISECWKRRLHAVFRRSQKSFACGPYLAATEWEDRKRSRWFNLWSFEFSSFQSCASLHFFSRISHYLILNVLPLASCEVGLLWLLCLYILVWSFQPTASNLSSAWHTSYHDYRYNQCGHSFSTMFMTRSPRARPALRLLFSLDRDLEN